MTSDGLAGFDVVHRLDPAQRAQLLALYDGEWWSAGRTLQDVERMLQGPSVIVGLVEPSSAELVGFVRSLSDGAFHAWVYDVIVKPSHRGRGLGRALLDRIVGHPALINVRRISLSCRPDMIAFYQRWQFQPFPEDSEPRLVRVRQ
ncbi:MAG: GNAT family N-acetyltransferase [Planctomycetota bacterium]